MAQHKTAVTPVLKHWSYHSLVLSHQYSCATSDARVERQSTTYTGPGTADIIGLDLEEFWLSKTYEPLSSCLLDILSPTRKRTISVTIT